MAEISKQALKVDNNQSFPNNNNGAITPAILRAFNVNMIDSMVDELSYNADSASWNVSISNINAFTSSLQTAFVSTASFNSFTSSINAYTASNNTKWNNAEVATSSLFTSVTNLNTFTASQVNSFNELNAWSASAKVSIGALNQASSSLQSFTQSANVSITNLNTTTASLLVETQNLELFSASALVSISNLNASSASQQVSIDSLNSKTGSYATTGSNTFTSANIFTSISASSFVSASEFIGNGSKITGITASIALPILDEGIPVGNAVSMNFTGSGIGATVVGGIAIVSVYAPDSASFNALTASYNSFTASTNADLNAIHQATASLQQFTASFNTASFVGTASFNSYTQSNDQRVSSLETNSASVNISVSNLNQATSSLFGSASLALVTASFDNGTRNLTFTKGDTQTFSVNIPDVSGSTGNFATTGSNTFVGNQTISGSLFVSGSEVLTGTLSASALRVENNTHLDGTLRVTNDAQFDAHIIIQGADPHLKLRDTSGGGGSAGYDVRVNTGSFEIHDDTHNRNVLSDIFNSASAQHTTSLTSEIIIISGSTSVTLIGNVSASIISASTINGLGDPLAFSTSVDSRLDGLEGVSGSFATTGSNSFNGNQIINGVVSISSSATYDLDITGGFQATAASRVSGSNGIANITQTFISVTSGSGAGAASFTGARGYIQVTGDGNIISLYSRPSSIGGFTDGAAGGGFAVRNTTSNYYPIQFQSTASFTDGRVTFTTPLSASAGFTASLQNGYAWVGNSLGENTQVATSSFIDNQVTSASFNAYTSSTDVRLNNIETTTASLLVETSNLEAFTSSQALLNTTFATTGSNNFVGNQRITGSLILSSSAAIELNVIGNSTFTGSVAGNVVSASITSNTASIDFSLGNYFELTSSVTPLHLNVTNITPGRTSTLIISASASSSILFSPNVAQPSGSAYSGSLGSIDILSLVSFNSSRVNLVSTKALV
jgi:hypothetical protein